MRTKIFDLLTNQLVSNHANFITHYIDNTRVQKSFCELSKDIDFYVAKFDYLDQQLNITTIGILGPTSYEWMVIDLACIKGGYKSVAIPESLGNETIAGIIRENQVTVLMLDYILRNKFGSLADASTIYFFRCGTVKEPNDWAFVPCLVLPKNQGQNRVLEEYGLVFSSGTSSQLKRISLKFITEVKRKKSWSQKLNDVSKWIAYKNSFWARKDNKMLVFLPFSHSQQRSFVLTCLLRKINIVLSDPLNCFRHLILEKPNILISVPLIYESLAMQIKNKLDNLRGVKKIAAGLFSKWHINRLANNNLLKKILVSWLFKKITAIYGGRADYFITGSAPINDSVITTFYRIGIKVFQGYGLSELGTVALSSHKYFKIGSVGKPLMPIRISEESEILVKYSQKYFSHVKHILNIDNDDYIHTGDLGFLDKQGYLFLKGRKDEVLVLSNGKKVFAVELEQKIMNHPFFKQVIVFLKTTDTICAIVVLHPPVSESGDRYLCAVNLNEINNKLADYERIQHYYLSHEAFSIENELLTGSFKIKRQAVIDRYKNETFCAIRRLS